MWITGTTFTDFQPGVAYTVTAPSSGATTTCTNPDPGGGGGGFTCSVAPNPNGTATVSWNGIGARGYDVSRDGQSPVWVTTDFFVDVTPGEQYTITAWGNGLGGTTTTCSA